MRQIPITIILLSLCAGCGISAGSLRSNPGYAEFNYPPFWKADEEISISLGPTVLNLARAVVDEGEEFSDLINDVEGLHLRVYSVENDRLEGKSTEQKSGALAAYINDSADRLSRQGWEKLITVKEEDEHVAVMVKLNQNTVQGMVVLVAEPAEAVFINIIGNIKPESLRPLIAQIYDDVPALTAL